MEHTNISPAQSVSADRFRIALWVLLHSIMSSTVDQLCCGLASFASLEYSDIAPSSDVMGSLHNAEWVTSTPEIIRSLERTPATEPLEQSCAYRTHGWLFTLRFCMSYDICCRINNDVSE